MKHLITSSTSNSRTNNTRLTFVHILSARFYVDTRNVHLFNLGSTPLPFGSGASQQPEERIKSIIAHKNENHSQQTNLNYHTMMATPLVNFAAERNISSGNATTTKSNCKDMSSSSCSSSSSSNSSCCSSSSSNDSSSSSAVESLKICSEETMNPLLKCVLVDLERFEREGNRSQIVEAWNALGLIRLHTQRNASAALCCHQQALSLCVGPMETSITYTDMGLCYERLGQEKDALKCYQQAFELLVQDSTISEDHPRRVGLKRVLARLSRM